MTRSLTIIGGGIAGLAAAHFAVRRGWRVRLFEATKLLGGNAATAWRGDFAFDLGAHRWHDRDAMATAEVKGLLRGAWHEVQLPSHVQYDERLVQFPLTPIDLARTLGLRWSMRAVGSLLRSRLHRPPADPSFEQVVCRRYGRQIARAFLLGYSEKLWGKPASELSPQVAGRRLAGLGLRTLVREALSGRAATDRHLEGHFYYPDRGIGEIARRLGEELGGAVIVTGRRVVDILCDADRVRAIRLDDGEEIGVDHLVATIPLAEVVNALVPQPSDAARAASRQLGFRSLRLVALSLDVAAVTCSATVYFPERRFPFTRLYEPRNRSPLMAPAGRSSIVAEIPCSPGDCRDTKEDGALIDEVSTQLLELGWFRRSQVLDGAAYRMRAAYPVLDRSSEHHLAVVLPELARLRNLSLVGRAARFRYLHLHDVIRSAIDLVEHLSTSDAP